MSARRFGGGLLAITPGDGRPLVDWLRAVAGAGADAVLIREPVADPATAIEALDAALALPIAVVLHDRTPGARALAVRHGLVLHLPDGAPLPTEQPFAASTHGGDTLERALAAGAAYATLSPVWSPTSKPDDRRPPLGLQRFLALATDRPVLALGGITPERYQSLRAAGAWGAAILGPLRGSPREAARAVEALLALREPY